MREECKFPTQMCNIRSAKNSFPIRNMFWMDRAFHQQRELGASSNSGPDIAETDLNLLMCSFAPMFAVPMVQCLVSFA